jgi:hypothetical protein
MTTRLRPATSPLVAFMEEFYLRTAVSLFVDYELVWPSSNPVVGFKSRLKRRGRPVGVHSVVPSWTRRPLARANVAVCIG